jgi:endo-1,4-beta-xylanase
MADRLTRRDMLATAVVAGGLAYATPLLTASAAPIVADAGSMTLRQRAARKGLLCGAEVVAPNLAKDTRLRDVLIQDANILVPGNELKWKRLQPTADGPMNFGPAEAIYDFARAHDMDMRGHSLTWYRGEPDWAIEKIGQMTAGQAGDFLTGYVGKVVGHWAGRLVQWDVANEPIDAKGNLSEPLFVNKLGERYLDLAFHAAHEADPTALLMMNATLVEQDWWYEDRQRDQTLRLVERLLKRGVPVQGFGLEGHLRTELGLSESKLRQFLDELTGMGLTLMVTELDVNDAGTLGSIPTRDQASAVLAGAFLDIMLSYRNCRGLLTWDAVDRYTWLATEPKKARADGAPQRPDLRDVDYKRKPLWHAVANAIDNAPAR